jgi:hypothetical protein
MKIKSWELIWEWTAQAHPPATVALAWFHGGAIGASPMQLGQGAMVHIKWWELRQNREGTTVNSPRRSTLSRKQWFRPIVMASPSKWKRTAVVLLSDLSVAVKGKTGSARHGEAFLACCLSMRGSRLEWRWWTTRGRAAAWFFKTKRTSVLYIRWALVQDIHH